MSSFDEMNDLVYNWQKLFDKIPKTVNLQYFFNDEMCEVAPFKAINEARAWVKDLGYSWGAMCRDNPIALSKDPNVTYIAKWRNIDRSDWKKIDGLFLSPDFRNGDVAVLLFSN